jgi:hypothetical protein
MTLEQSFATSIYQPRPESAHPWTAFAKCVLVIACLAGTTAPTIDQWIHAPQFHAGRWTRRRYHLHEQCPVALAAELTLAFAFCRLGHETLRVQEYFQLTWDKNTLCKPIPLLRMQTHLVPREEKSPTQGFEVALSANRVGRDALQNSSQPGYFFQGGSVIFTVDRFVRMFTYWIGRTRGKGTRQFAFGWTGQMRSLRGKR